jgi:hypothetical protein
VSLKGPLIDVINKSPKDKVKDSTVFVQSSLIWGNDDDDDDVNKNDGNNNDNNNDGRRKSNRTSDIACQLHRICSMYCALHKSVTLQLAYRPTSPASMSHMYL